MLFQKLSDFYVSYLRGNLFVWTIGAWGILILGAAAICFYAMIR